MTNIGLLISNSIASLATRDVLSSVSYFVQSMGGTLIVDPKILTNTNISLLRRFMIYTSSKAKLLRYSRNLKKDLDAVLLPYPNVGNSNIRTNPALHFDLKAIKRIKYEFGIPIILFVYDIYSLRALPLYGIPVSTRELQLEQEILSIADVVMVFNEKSKQYLSKEFRIDPGKIVCYEILDLYIPQCDKLLSYYYGDKCILNSINVAIAGNLSEVYIGQSLDKLPNSPSIRYNLYGSSGSWISRKDMLYHGTLSGRELIERLSSENSFGLLIYNDSLSSYLRYTPTTKFSLYLLAGLPIVSPVDYEYPSKLIKKYKLGILVKNMSKVPVILEKTYGSERYIRFKNNVLKLRSDICAGNHFKKALLNALSKLK